MIQDNNVIKIFTGKDKLKWKSSSEKVFGEKADPKHYLAYKILIGVFIIGLIVTALIVINFWAIKGEENKMPDCLNTLMGIWEVFIPIATLILGYEFGKHENIQSNQDSDR